MNSDSVIVEEVRDRAARISERFGHDLYRYAKHLADIQDKHRERVVSQVTVVPMRGREVPPTA